jgi:hypothetical protein
MVAGMTASENQARIVVVEDEISNHRHSRWLLIDKSSIFKHFHFIRHEAAVTSRLFHGEP